MAADHACVIVLGDLNRSPRTVNHAISLTKNGYSVSLLGYTSPNQSPMISKCPHIRTVSVQPWPEALQAWLPKSLNLVAKAVWLTLSLIWALVFALTVGFSTDPDRPTNRGSHRTRLVLVQNPPAIPTLVIVYFTVNLYNAIADFRSPIRHQSCLFVVDWHNYAFTLQGLTLERVKSKSFRQVYPKPLVMHGRVSFVTKVLLAISARLEHVFGRRADFGLTVSQAMANDLLCGTSFPWPLSNQPDDVRRIKVLYDWPVKRSLPSESRSNFVRRLAAFDPQLEHLVAWERLKADGVPEGSQPKLFVSSTSWSADEDFGILVDALDRVHCRPACNILCIVTGRGPLQRYFMDKIRRLKWIRIKFIAAWLPSPDDYRRLLSMADMGICLHVSSSGLDLPMKIVDMYSEGLPVAALRYAPALPELVIDRQTGFLFDDVTGLAKILDSLVDDSGDFDTDMLKQISANIVQLYAQRDWDRQWKDIVLPIIGRPQPATNGTSGNATSD